MIRFQQWFATARGYLGRTGAAGSLLLAISVSLWLGAILPLQHRITALSEQEDNTVSLLPQPPPDQATIAKDRKDRLAKFYREFPSLRGYAPRLAHLYNAAQREGLVLSDGSYHAVGNSQGRLTRYEITLPIKGNYVQVRHFLRRVLNEFPTMALNRLTLQRASIGVSQVEAEIQLVWYLEDKA
jgi:hypothetical protein